ncbi:MAG: DUF898 family protein [Candidatus Latescibacteria bacterium]|nr:DUF898 family protein [Candidatus Latescibacterota bacterium]
MHLKPFSRLTVYFFVLWGTISSGNAQEVSVVPQDTTAAGRWSLIAGTAFLNAGELPYIDREGGMWWGYQDDVFVLRQNQLSKITVGWRVSTIVQDSTDAMWFFGHHSDSLIAARYDGVIRETTKTKLKWNLIVSPPAVVDGKGRFWMRAHPLYERRSSGGYGIFEYTNNRWFHHTTETGLRSDRIYDLTVDQEGYLWAATYRGVSQYRDEQWHNYGRGDGLSNEKVYRIVVGKNGDLWCTHGNRENISIYDGDKWRVINTDSGMPFGEVRAALCARDGTFYFGVHYHDITDPEQSGLVRFDGQSWLVLTERDGLPGNHVLGISELVDGKLLLQIRKSTLAVFESDATPLQISDQALVVFEPDTTRWARISGYVKNRDGTAVEPVAVSLTTPRRHVKASTVTNAQGFYEVRVLPGKYRIQVPDALGGKRNIVVAPGEVVRGMDIRPFWFMNSAKHKTIFALVFFFFVVMVLVGLLYIVIRAFAVQPLKVPELSEAHNPLRLRFHGNGSSLFGIFAINTLLTLLTLGVYYFWGKAKIRRYMHSQTELHNSRFSNHTTGGELCIGWIKAIILILAITLISEAPSFFWENWTHEWITLLAFYGLLLFVFLPLAIVGSLRFRLSRTSYQGIRMSFRGNSKTFFKIYYIGLLKTIFTLGLYYPYFETKIRLFLTRSVRFGTGSFKFFGTGRKLFWHFVLALLLTPFTLGFCWAWYSARKTRYYWSCTTFEGVSFHSTVVGSRLLLLKVENFILLVISLGLAWPWVAVRNNRFLCDYLVLSDHPDFSSIAQDFSDATTTGEGLSDYLDFEFEF